MGWCLPDAGAGDLLAEVITYRMVRLGEPLGARLRPGWARSLHELTSDRVLAAARALIKLHSARTATRNKRLVQAARQLQDIIEQWHAPWTGGGFVRSSEATRQSIRERIASMDAQPSCTSYEHELLQDLWHGANDL